MKTPLVSIIVPCYKLAQYLPETLDSVLAQTYQNWECIIVNDGSPDNTEEVANAYLLKDVRFKYFFKENSGVADTRNFGIKNSDGEYILPLDADDIIAPIYVEKAVERFVAQPQTAAVFSEGEFFGAFQGKIDLPAYDYKTLLFTNTFFEPVFFKRSDFDKTIGYQMNMKKGWEDWEFMIRLLDENSVVYKIPEICYFYRILPTSRERNITEEAKKELFLQIYENNKVKYDKIFPNPILFGYFLEKEKREKEFYKNAFENMRKSKKYKLVRKLKFWK